MSGSDVTQLLLRLGALLDAQVRVELETQLELDDEDCDPLAYGCRASGNTLYIRLSLRASLRATAKDPEITPRALEAARLLSVPLAACLSAPIAERALRAEPTETHAEALVQLHRFVELSPQGELLHWSDGAERYLKEDGDARGVARFEAPLLAAVQAFLRGERNLQRLSPALSVSFGVLAGTAVRGELIVGALHAIDEHSEDAARFPAALLLSATELAVTRRLLSGEPESAIAERLGLATSTVKTHRHGIYRKLGVASRLELASLFRH